MSAEHALAAAAAAAVNAVSLPGARAYPLADVPDALPDVYVEVSVHRRVVLDGHRGDGSVSRRGYRILTRAVARDAGNADQALADVTTALDFTTLDVDIAGQDGETVVEFETGDAVAPDDGWYSALHTWTCSLPIIDPK